MKIQTFIFSIFFFTEVQANNNQESNSLWMIPVVASLLFLGYHFSKKPKSIQSKQSTHSTLESQISQEEQDLKQEYLNRFEDYKIKMLPQYIAYYVNIKAKEKNLSFAEIDELYAKHGKCQVMPIIELNEIFKDIQNKAVIANECVKTWASRYGIESKPDGVISHMKAVLTKLSKEKSEVIIHDFLKEKAH